MFDAEMPRLQDCRARETVRAVTIRMAALARDPVSRVGR